MESNQQDREGEAMAYKILGHEPNGIKPKGAKHERVPAIPQELVAGNEAMLLNEASNLVLTVIGRQGAYCTTIDPAGFHEAIRKRYPEGYYERSPNQEISELDEWHYACRVAERLLAQIEGAFLDLDGGYGSHDGTMARARSIFKAVQDIAARRGVELVRN
jgi:hypothetical protein